MRLSYTTRRAIKAGAVEATSEIIMYWLLSKAINKYENSKKVKVIEVVAAE